MKLRTLACLIGALAISSAPFVLAVSGGGFPSLPQFLGVGVNTPAQTVTGLTIQQVSPNVTAIQAKNDTAHDVEILATTSTAGNAQFRATNFGGTNWSWGNVRSSSAFQICNAASLATGQCYTFNTTGQVVLPAPSTGSTLNVTGVSGGVSPAIFATGSAGASGLEINSGMSLTLNSAGTNFGMVQNDAADHWCLASGTSLSTLGTNIFCWDKNQNITAPGSGTKPWSATPITCTTSCSGASLAVGQMLILVKGTSTSRASVTAVSVDPDLQVTSLPTGLYQVDVSVNVSAGANAGGYRVEMASSTSCTGYNGQGFWIFGDTPTVLRSDTGVANTTIASSSGFLYTTHTYSNNGSNGVMVCWAQSVSNATSTTVLGGAGSVGPSQITLTRIN